MFRVFNLEADKWVLCWAIGFANFVLDHSCFFLLNAIVHNFRINDGLYFALLVVGHQPMGVGSHEILLIQLDCHNAITILNIFFIVSVSDVRRIRFLMTSQTQLLKEIFFREWALFSMDGCKVVRCGSFFASFELFEFSLLIECARLWKKRGRINFLIKLAYDHIYRISELHKAGVSHESPTAYLGISTIQRRIYRGRRGFQLLNIVVIIPSIRRENQITASWDRHRTDSSPSLYTSVIITELEKSVPNDLPIAFQLIF